MDNKKQRQQLEAIRLMKFETDKLEIGGKTAKLVQYNPGPYVQIGTDGKWQLVAEFKKYAAGQNEYESYQILGSGFNDIHEATQFRLSYERLNKK